MAIEKELTATAATAADIINELVENGDVFDCRGYATVMRTKIVEETVDGVTTKRAVTSPMRLPIKSTGVAEYMEKLTAKAPRPPVIKEMIKKNSPEGKAMGLPHNQIVQVFDTTDEGYIDELEKHNQEFTWKVAVFALDLTWTGADGSVASTFERKKQILQSNKITAAHIEQIFAAVKSLTEFAEEREDFLSES
ncbi:MAG: hypothetical protein M0P69_11165 [Bacteroidales bacterium]|nr:hypothetical protein [Bacteroidales bacterium]